MNTRVDEVVFRALEKDPGRRFQDVAELGRALEAARFYKSGEAVGDDPAAPKATRRKARAPVRRRVCSYAVGAVTWSLGGLLLLAASALVHDSAEEGRFGGEMKRQSMQDQLRTLKQHARLYVRGSDVPQSLRAEIRELERSLEAPAAKSGGRAILVWILGGLAFTAPFGATVLGIASIRRLRRSGGVYYGRPLAVTAATFYPLILMDGLLVALFLSIKRETDLWNILQLIWMPGIFVLDIAIVWALARFVSRPAAPSRRA